MQSREIKIIFLWALNNDTVHTLVRITSYSENHTIKNPI